VATEREQQVEAAKEAIMEAVEASGPFGASMNEPKQGLVSVLTASSSSPATSVSAVVFSPSASPFTPVTSSLSTARATPFMIEKAALTAGE
jgi:hypothetical protein